MKNLYATWMNRSLCKTYQQPTLIPFMSASIVLMLFLWEGRAGFEFGDEGLLWYISKRIMHGEVPMRDYISYSPGRYYWSAALMTILNDNGFVALRIAESLFQFIGLSLALITLARQSGKIHSGWLFVIAITLAVWMIPRFYQYDMSISIMLVAAYSYLLECPSLRRYFLAGVTVGLAACFGRNHGVYGLIGGMGVLAYLAFRREDSVPGVMTASPIFGFGVMVGYLPMLLMLLYIPGFAAAWWEAISFVLDIKTVGLPIPVPWPWRLESARFADDLGNYKLDQGVLISLSYMSEWFRRTCYIGVVAYCILGPAWLIWRKMKNNTPRPDIVAASILSVPYAHAIFSRADIAHLAYAIFPLLISALAIALWQKGVTRWISILTICGTSFLIMLPRHPAIKCQFLTIQCVDYAVGKDMLKLTHQNAASISALKNEIDTYASDGKSFYIAPHMPGVYAIFDRKAPVRNVYSQLPRRIEFQMSEVERLKAANLGLAIIADLALDDREELRFRNTNPLIDSYIRNSMTLVESENSIDHFVK